MLLLFRRVSFAIAMLFLFASNLTAGTQPKDLPKPTDYVSDLAHVLSPQEVKNIDGVCSQLDHSGVDVQIAVVTISSLDGVDVAEYAKTLGNIWGVGKSGTDRGVVVLLAIDDHKWRIAVGRGLEKILSNPKAMVIGEKMVPQLRANNFGVALEHAVRDIAKVVFEAGSKLAVAPKAISGK